MADFTADENQHPEIERPASPASSIKSSSSSSTANSEVNHNWVARQMRLYRTRFVETLNIKIKIVTWNVNGKRVSEDLTSLLVEDSETGIYAIGYGAESIPY